jgi:hypothetical protein
VGFVDDEQPRVVEYGLGDSDAAFHAAGVGLELPAGNGVKGDELKHLVDAGRPAAVVGDALEYGEVVEELAGVEVGVEAKFLWQVAEHGLRRSAGWVMSEPSTVTVPPVGRSTPARTRMSVVLPAPLGQRSPGKPGPGRPPGSKNRRPAPRHDVGKTTKRELTLKARQERAG